MFSKKEINEYFLNGFIVKSNFINPSITSKFKKEIDSIIGESSLGNHDKTKMEMEPNQKITGRKVRRLYEPCTHYPLFEEYASSSLVLDHAECLLGKNIFFHYSKLNMKASSVGAVVEWHQDLAYYPLTNKDSLAILLYIDDATKNNGCLKVIPKYHTKKLLNHTTNGFFQGMITEKFDTTKAMNLEGKSGTAIFMHCMVPHASNMNTSNFQRRTLISSYRAADAFPILINSRESSPEKYAKIVRGDEQMNARFTMKSFPIPKYHEDAKSLFSLQDRAKKTLINDKSLLL